MHLSGTPLLLVVLVLFVCNAFSAEEPFEVAQGGLILRSGVCSLPVRLSSPNITLGSEMIPPQPVQIPPNLKAELLSGRDVECPGGRVSLSGGSTLDIKLLLRWSPAERTLRKWGILTLQDGAADGLLSEVVLEEWETGTAEGVRLAPRQPLFIAPQSYPVFVDGFFAGIEFPVATTAATDQRIRLSHAPGVRLARGKAYSTRKAVYGIAQPGLERAAFESYILAHSPGPLRPHIGWDTFWGLEFPCTEATLLRALEVFKTHLCERNGIALDAYILDIGWSDPQSIWKMHRERFPSGFSKVTAMLRGMKSRLGLWMSPSAQYPMALDAKWAHSQGYERLMKPGRSPYPILCQAGPRYQREYRDSVLALYREFGLAYSKFDGYTFVCPEVDHGHEPGPLSAERIAEGIADTMTAMHREFPDAWINPTCFGMTTSPWWLFYANSVTGNFGDDTVWGRVPAPVYRESHVTARDLHNLQGIYHNPIPVARLDVFGGLSNSDSGPFLNDAVVTFLRGPMHILIDIDPGILNARGWSELADVIRWMRRNAPVLQHTAPLFPAAWRDGNLPRIDYAHRPAPRDPYGYAHLKGNSGIVLLRNPWITHQEYALKLDTRTGLATMAAGLSAVSLYPENRVYGRSLTFGDTLVVPLRPYETVVLSLERSEPAATIPRANAASPAITVRMRERDVVPVEFEGTAGNQGADGIDPTDSCSRALWTRLQGTVDVAAPEAELLFLSEEESDAVNPLGAVWINGRKVEPVISGPHTRFNADSHPIPEHWQMLCYPLARGTNEIALELLTRTREPKVSAWVWAWKAGTPGASTVANSLPQPERIPLDSFCLVPETRLDTNTEAAVRMGRPVEKIDGTYLDTIEPVKVEGELRKNRSAGKGPLSAGGEKFARGLGTMAPFRGQWNIGGGYRRFQARVGVGAMYMNSRSYLVFEVWGDGKKLWDSGTIAREDPPKSADVDITGVRTLELRVRDTWNRPMYSDFKWGNWGEPRLLRSAAPTGPRPPGIFAGHAKTRQPHQ